ncbi:MAG: hypothetical protein KA436_08605 [Oligoflexales bacterium]|nr:hypothetical protein [Oligoflexales bacterium]
MIDLLSLLIHLLAAAIFFYLIYEVIKLKHQRKLLRRFIFSQSLVAGLRRVHVDSPIKYFKKLSLALGIKFYREASAPVKMELRRIPEQELALLVLSIGLEAFCFDTEKGKLILQWKSAKILPDTFEKAQNLGHILGLDLRIHVTHEIT